MKSYSVKSNAKRFARGVAAKYPDLYAAVEPTLSPDGEWFPVLELLSESPLSILEEISETCLFVKTFKSEPALASVTINTTGMDVSGLKAMFDAVPPVGDVDSFFRPAPDVEKSGKEAFIENWIAGTNPIEPVPVTVTLEQSIDRKHWTEVPEDEYSVTVTTTPVASLTEAETLAAAASLPAPVKSSREEIEARREERRARIDREKAEGVRTPSGEKVKGKKISKKNVLLDLIRRAGGATQTEIESATGWQRHTVRGYIAGTLRKQLAVVGFEIECTRGKGDVPTRYTVKKIGGA